MKLLKEKTKDGNLLKEEGGGTRKEGRDEEKVIQEVEEQEINHGVAR